MLVFHADPGSDIKCFYEWVGKYEDLIFAL